MKEYFIAVCLAACGGIALAVQDLRARLEQTENHVNELEALVSHQRDQIAIIAQYISKREQSEDLSRSLYPEENGVVI